VTNREDPEFPPHLLYDIENQIWYEPLGDGTIRAGFTRWAANLMGEILVFTPKRLNFDFEKERSFGVVEGGKWVGSARAAFDGVVVRHNERLDRTPELLNQDPYGDGWMLVVRPSREDWRDKLVDGALVKPAFDNWIATASYKDRRG
jgi:glycine cleavage system H protein